MDKKKMLEEMLKNYLVNVAILKNIDLDIEDINSSDNPGLKEVDRLNKIKQQKQLEVQRVNNLLSSLKDRDRTIIEMKYFKRMKYENMAVELDLSSGYIACLKHKIINKLAADIQI